MAGSQYMEWLVAILVSRGNLWLIASMTKKPVQPQDKYVLRLPDGLRDRIKAHAERHGRSMNAEIVRVLEEAFPEPWPLEARIGHLMDLMEAMKSGASNEAVARFVDAVDETLAGMAQGRVEGLTDEQIKYIKDAFVDYQIEMAKIGWFSGNETLDTRDAIDTGALDDLTSSAKNARFLPTVLVRKK